MSFEVLTREQVSPQNQEIFDTLKKNVGFVPNLYATFAHSESALGNYLTFQNGKSSLKAKEREVVNLVVSQINECLYCQSAHTALGKMNGFTDEQILELRGGSASFDPKLDALVKVAKAITETKGRPEGSVVENFFAAGYSKGNLVDVILVIGDKIISNYLYGVGNMPIDFPLAPELETAAV